MIFLPHLCGRKIIKSTSLVTAESVEMISVFIISAMAGILLKSQDVYFFFSKIFVVILNNSDILLCSEYKCEV